MPNITIQIPEAATNRAITALSKYGDPTIEPSGPNAKAGLVALVTDYIVGYERKRIQLASEQKRSEEEAATGRVEGIA